MNEILRYFVKSLANSTLSLKKKGILVEKPWALIDEDGAIQKLIFKKDKGLILSKNGRVTEGTWDYFPEAGALLIDRISDKLLLKEQFIDENVMILKKDGTENEFFALANENTLPDYNIPEYLNTLRCAKLNLRTEKLYSGKIIHIHQEQDTGYIWNFNGKYVEQLDSSFNPMGLPNGAYLTENKSQTFYVEDNRIRFAATNIIRTLKSGETIEIEEGVSYGEGITKNVNKKASLAFWTLRDIMYGEGITKNVNKKVTINGEKIQDERLLDIYNNIIYEIKESVIINIFFSCEYLLNNGNEIIIEQKDIFQIRKGDKIVSATSLYPLPDGSYRIKGRLFKIRVKDGVVV